jgi:thiol-disulfide isomerase/thioredoxin
MIPLGTRAPEFTLREVVHARPLTLDDVRGAYENRGTVIMFLCNHCPYVKYIQDEIVHVANDYTPLGISFAAISSNDAVAYPEDAPDKMKYEALRLGYAFPYLYDETQDVARAYQAVCTPDFFVFDAELRCVYRGQFDDARPSNDLPVSGRDLRNALDNLLAGRTTPESEQRPSLGCNIKWKPSHTLT